LTLRNEAQRDTVRWASQAQRQPTIGLLPFASPDSIKKVYKTMVETPESSLRMMGLASIVAGLVLLYLV